MGGMLFSLNEAPCHAPPVVRGLRGCRWLGDPLVYAALVYLVAYAYARIYWLGQMSIPL